MGRTRHVPGIHPGSEVDSTPRCHRRGWVQGESRASPPPFFLSFSLAHLGTLIRLQAWEHDQKTGFRLPSVLFGPGYEKSCASLRPPPRSFMDQWLRTAASAANSAGKAAKESETTGAATPVEPKRVSLVVGTGRDCHRAALAAFTSLRFCEGDENVRQASAPLPHQNPKVLPES